ncbi:MAG: hypothetical protein KKB91_06760 [Proteobacteria bacterium]|nr:hypothetical protein [Pseudomonadota bacterium]MBU4327428.1 hypothetical protein [Pseudomonadota bacterium]
MDTKKSKNPGSRLLPVLREGICVVQMVLFKELRSLLTSKLTCQDSLSVSMLTGAITNELFGTLNSEEIFQEFRRKNRTDIEQELLSLARELPALRAPLTDALRIQTLCDNMEDKDSAKLLNHAAEIGLLIQERELPLPSTFMTMARSLGDAHQLIITPVEISQEDDKRLVQ